MQRIAKELEGEKIMPPLAEKLMIKGEIKGKQELLIKLLRRKFGLPFSCEKTIRSVADGSKLDAKSKDEVLKMLGSTNV